VKQYVFILLGIILASIFVFSAIEIFLRTDGRYRLYHERNHQPYASQYTGRTTPEHLFRYKNFDSITFRKKEFTETRTINKLGFTDHREIRDIDTSSSTIRILTLGDSFTEGMGARYDESWPQALEHLLNNAESIKSFIVYNAGVSGCDPFFSFQNLKFLFPQLHPDIVILLINTTDYTDVYFRGGWERFKEGDTVIFSRQAPWWEWLYARSHTVRGMAEWAGYNIFLTKDPYEVAIMSTFPVIKQALDSFRIHSEKNNYVFIPMFNPIPTYHSEEQYRQDSLFVYGYMAPQNPLFLDLTEAVRSHRTPEYFWESDNHCTAKGYRLFAERIHAHLRETLPEIFLQHP